MSEQSKPMVGIGIMVMKGDRVLVGKRKGSHGSGEWAFPGGHLEYMESFEHCALREIAEECGIKVRSIRYQMLANVTAYAPKHYVHVGLIADWEVGEPQVLEPDRCEQWVWADVHDPPQPLFVTAKQAIEAYHSGKTYLDAPT